MDSVAAGLLLQIAMSVLGGGHKSVLLAWAGPIMRRLRSARHILRVVHRLRHDPMERLPRPFTAVTRVRNLVRDANLFNRLRRERPCNGLLYQEPYQVNHP